MNACSENISDHYVKVKKHYPVKVMFISKLLSELYVHLGITTLVMYSE